jgi:hypothetical protein
MLCLFCLRWWPVVPGVAIGLLALIAVIMAVRADNFTGSEKAIWVVISLMLCVVELRTIYADRNEHDRQQADQLKQFRELAATSKESLDNITGGDSYTYIAADIGLRPPFQLSVWVRGTHGVHNVSAEIQEARKDNTQASIRRQMHTMRALQLGTGEFLPGITGINEMVMSGTYYIRVATRNGSINEELTIEQCDDGFWQEILKMNGAGEKENKTWGRENCHSEKQHKQS